MDLGTHVVCFGHDPVLLESRCQVLATRFHANSVVNLEELEQAMAASVIDLLVICHSVPEVDCRAAMAMADHSPQAIETVLLTLNQAPWYAPAHTIRAQEGPGVLLNRLSELLRGKRFKMDHAANISTTLFSSHPVLQPAEELHREARQSRKRNCRPQT